MNCLVRALKESGVIIEALCADLRDLQAVVDKQALDPGLWFDIQTAPEAYVVQELRKLHAAIETVTERHSELLKGGE